MPGNERLTEDLAATLRWDVGRLEIRAFPDGETYLRFITSPADRPMALVCTLSHPNKKLLPLLFASATARELGASSVGLVAPYLAYMRQDRRFRPGEAVTSRQVARLLSDAFDWLVTVDPHLHRYHSLADVYTVPTHVVHAAPIIANWIKANVNDPLIIGPDSESEQWVAAVASDVGAPYSILDKVRRGDRDVEIRFKDPEQWRERTPVLVDDIISTGHTMIEAVRLLTSQGWRRPVCVAVHGLFSDDADVLLARAGASVVTTNSVPHPTNAIDIGMALADAITRVHQCTDG
jgi:ribose-phosphate pyrophosphokinase